MKAKREQYIVFINVGTKESPEWEKIGKDNDNMARTLNNEVNSTKNVLGVSSTEITKGNAITTVDPYKQDSNYKLSKILHDIYFNGSELSELEHEFLEVSLYEEPTEAREYSAFKQTGAIDLKSHGGDTTGVSDPFDINWVGERVYGTFNPATAKFTETTA